jgi:beta-galactosidase
LRFIRLLTGAALLVTGTTAFAADAAFPYGAVYFRKSNPPEQDWARDHATAAQIGMNTFRHWFMWEAVEVAPGKYDWSDYDRMMDLAAKNGIKVVIAELVTSAPEWVYDKYPHARYKASDDSYTYSGISASSATGGFPGLCLDNEDVKALAEKFLTALVERYKNHPATLGYDVWNENTYDGGSPTRMHCFCDATQRRFREWLRAQYGSLDVLSKTWYRYSYADWDNVHPPRNFSGYPESLDWLEFRMDDAFRLMKWRTDLIRKLDGKNKVVAHGVAGTLETLPANAHNEWRSAALVDTWGLTWIAARKGDEPWKQFQALDLVRGGTRGKPFWHAEAQAGPLWLQPQVIHRARGRPHRRRERRTAMEPDRLRRRGHGDSVSPLAPPIGRSAIRRIRRFRHGWLGDSPRGDDRPRGEVGQRSSRALDVKACQRRPRAGLCTGIRNLQLRAAGQHQLLR